MKPRTIQGDKFEAYRKSFPGGGDICDFTQPMERTIELPLVGSNLGPIVSEQGLKPANKAYASA
jgi:hypothetical protein